MPTSPKPTLRLHVALWCVLLCGLALLAPRPAGAAVAKGPAGLAFYHPPKGLGKGHGSPIWVRKADGLARLSGAASTRLLLYTSTTPQGKTAAVSGTVSVPKGKAPAGGWPVITYAHATTGTADSCAPSRNRTGGPAESYISYAYPQLEEWVKAGYAVVQTDYQGLGTPGPHPFLVGAAEGRSVLDMVAAARKLDPRIGAQYLIAGHSQGGQSALFAAALAPTWQPALKLRGTVAFAPVSHLLDQAKFFSLITSPSSLTALAAQIIKGATAASPKIVIPKLLSDAALALYPQLDRKCQPALAMSDSYGGLAPSQLIRDGADRSALYSVLGKENPAVKTKLPILIAQGTADTTVFPFFTDQLAGELKDLGDKLTYTKYQDVTHGGIVAAAGQEALAFFKKRLPPR